MAETKPVRIRVYVIVCALSVLITWILHELAHWATGKFLGYEMRMSLNQSYPSGKKFLEDIHYLYISAAGPVFTLLQALVVFGYMRCKESVMLYPLLYTCFYRSLMATILSLRMLNDEARVSNMLGIGDFTLPVLMTGLLTVLVMIISRRYRFSARFNLTTLILIITFSSLLILIDLYFKIRLL